MYIRAAGNISPQKTFGNVSFLADPVEHFGNRLKCVEPDYKSLLDAKLIRRMSRIIKIGVAAAMECLQKADVAVPDAIITGTAYGCLEDTGVFLSKMVEQEEELLAPTAFIQSTHNTVGAQIALMLHCHGYNNVFVHRGFSFENALLDALLLLRENEATNVLVGGLDEITDHSHGILTRLGLYKRNPLSNFNLYKDTTRGTIAGEGAAFFLLTDQQSGNNYARLNGLTTFYKPENILETTEHISSFLSDNSVDPATIDLLITGRSGDPKGDGVYDQLALTVFNNIETINYKNLCGEYPTSVAFALWLAINIIHGENLPTVFNHKTLNKKIKTILIYNHSQNTHHSLLLVSAC